MKVFICGGGAGNQTIRAMKRLNEVIDHNLPCLYIPLAMEADNYDSCYRWITNELKCLDIPGIDMVSSAEELSGKCLDKYSFLFIGGGNTFKLLYDIKRVNMFEPIREYLLNGGVAFGGSAGAIIFGQDLESCALDDDNKVGLLETGGFDVLGGISFLCHFTNRDEEHDRRSEEYLLEISKHRKVYALPEEDTLFWNEDHLEEIIDRPYFVFDNGKKIMVNVTRNIEIRQMTREDIPAICKADNDETESFVEYLNRQLDFQDKNECSAIVALCDNQIAGYVFLYYRCKWGALKNQGLPGICDLVVFEKYRRNGIATLLMDRAEAQAKRVNTKVYLDVCLNADYGAAQCFYVLRGYVPDGKGVYYMEHVLKKNATCKNDDELTLCFIKELTKEESS